MKFPFKCMQNDQFDPKVFFERPTPNIIHFVFGLDPQEKPFSFVHYLAVYSAYRINHPTSIYFHRHHPSYGKWWDRLLVDVPILLVKDVDIPTHIGDKEILRTAHKADKVRMDILFEMGGVYMDIDTISVRPYRHLLDNDTTMCKQYMLRYKHTYTGVYSTPYIGGICNAIMLTKARSPFFELWRKHYETAFNPKGWEEASIWLPLLLANKRPSIVTVLEPPAFNVPCCWEGKKVFSEDTHEIPEELLTLHLCETMSKEYVDAVTGWDWMETHPNTMYAKMMAPFHVKCMITNNCYGVQYYAHKERMYNTPFVGMFMYAPCYMHLLENYDDLMSMDPEPCEASKYGSGGPQMSGCVLRLGPVEMHFIHTENAKECVETWVRRRTRMYAKEDCDVKLCDRDLFDDDIARRFMELRGFKSKTLFLSNRFRHIDALDSVDIVRLDVATTPDGYQLECAHPIL